MRIHNFTPKVDSIKNGLCEGQCLHWIRRVLQGGRETYQVPVQKGTIARTDEQILGKHKKQHAVSAKTHIDLKNAKETVGKQRIDDFNKKLEALLAKHGITKSNGYWHFSTQEQQQLLNRALEKKQAFVDDMNAKGIYSYHWETLARELDQFIKGKFGGSKRPFSNIVAVKCVNRTDSRFGNGQASGFANAIASEVEFRPDRCVLMCAGLAGSAGESGGEISGHAIAGHYKPSGELFLFDPNLGIFRCSSKENFRRALEIVMGSIWPRDFNWTLSGSFGYSVFRAASQDSTKPNEKPVVYTTEAPRFTGVQNMALGTIPKTPKSTPTKASPPKPTPTPITKGKPPTGGAPQKFAPQSPPKSVGTSKGKVGGNVSKLMEKFQH
jgi:hypothetical protein